jgi:hypothetical protein
LAFFSKTNVMITIFANTSSSLSKKRQFFREIFRRKYLKNHNIGPSKLCAYTTHVHICLPILWSETVLWSWCEYSGLSIQSRRPKLIYFRGIILAEFFKLNIRIKWRAHVPTHLVITWSWKRVAIEMFGLTFQGSILWSQFSAIFPDFGRKFGVFLKNQCYDANFAKTSSSLTKKRQFFRQSFRRKYFKNHNIGPWYRFLGYRLPEKNSSSPEKNPTAN